MPDHHLPEWEVGGLGGATKGGPAAGEQVGVPAKREGWQYILQAYLSPGAESPELRLPGVGPQLPAYDMC